MDLPNFRVAGRQSGGKLKTKAIHLDLNIPVSIPAKIATIIVDEKMHKGFGSTANRFSEADLDNEDAAPGPGAYEAQRIPKFEIDKRGGSGGFASKSDRFRLVVRRSPAPNAYQKVNTAARPKSDPNPTIILRRSLRTASLHNSCAPVRATSATAAVGPGSYDPKHPSVSEGVPVTVSFRSRSQRSQGQPQGKGTSASPDPCSYDVRQSLIRMHAPVLGRPSRSSRGVFVGADLSRLPDSLAKDVFTKEVASVGPGSYDPKLPASAKAITSAFAQPEGEVAARNADDELDGEDEEATVDTRGTPGPGTYDPRVRPLPVTSAAAAFRSASQNHAVFAGKNPNPGPSYYKPRLATVRESFINNAGNRWL